MANAQSTANSRPVRIYLAGKITGTSWREDLVVGLRDWEAHHPECHRIGNDWPILYGAIGGHDYVGPYAMYSECDNPLFTVEKGHASLADASYANGSHVWGRNYSPDGDARGPLDWPWEIVRRCKAAIDAADVVFVWLDHKDVHGTLVELGYAIGRGTQVLLGLDDSVFRGHHDLWFVENFLCLTQSWLVGGHNIPHVYTKTAADALWTLGKKRTERPEYYGYIESQVWREKAEAAKMRAGGRCQVCNATGVRLDAHHRTYERLGHELAADITVLCRHCHELFETKRKSERMGV